MMGYLDLSYGFPDTCWVLPDATLCFQQDAGFVRNILQIFARRSRHPHPEAGTQNRVSDRIVGPPWKPAMANTSTFIPSEVAGASKGIEQYEHYERS
jgi:hypothetical protein